MNFEAVIGLEIHVEMKTKSKMFSPSPNAFSKEPNTHITPFDMAFPGTMPTVNKQAVINGIRVANALHMEIDHLLRFDRKNYFYADLPKGFQITQEFHPLGKDGYVAIFDKEGHRKIVHIERIHLEEDTCKQLHMDTYTLLDYNRAGVPLVEIVSCPEIRNGFEAGAYVEAIRNIVVYSGCSDGKMEEGSLRCDVNISLRPLGEETFGTKVELKNLNSIKNIERAIDKEIARQKECLLQGKPILQETRRYDESSGKTLPMRLKTDAVDYKCFPEPNIAPIVLSDDFVKEAIVTCPELYEAKKERYLSYGLTQNDATIILSNPEMAAYFEEASKGAKNIKTVANFLIVEINGYLNKRGMKIKELPLKGSALGEIANLQEEGFTHKQCVDVLNYCIENEGAAVLEAIDNLSLSKQISDDDLVLELVGAVLDANPQSIADFKAGKDRAKSFLIGQAMKLGKGKVNPSAVAKIMSKELAKR